MSSEGREQEPSPAQVRSDARVRRRQHWIDQCRQAIAEGRARQAPVEDDTDDENP